MSIKNRILENDALKEKQKAKQTRNDVADRLVESMSKTRTDIVGKKWLDSYNKNPDAIRRTAVALKMQESYLTRLGEAVTSSSFPIPLQNLLRVIRLSYPNMVYPEIFTAFQMQRWHDSIYYLKTIYNSNKRDGVLGAKTYETMTRRYSTEVEVATIDANGSSTSYSGTISGVVAPLRPYKVLIYIGGQPVAVDGNGDGILSGSYTANGSTITVTGTINYTNGAYTLTLSGAPNVPITVEYNFDSEVKDNYDEIGGVELRVDNYMFRPEPMYLGIDWSLMAQHQLEGTLDEDIDEILTSASYDLIRQNKDIRHLSYGYNLAKKTAPIKFNADHVSANALSMIDHLDSFKYAISRANTDIYNTYNRGQINVMYGTANAVGYISGHRNWVANTSAIAKGCYLAGSLNGINVYQVPNKVMEDSGDTNSVNDLVAVYKDNVEEMDVAIAIGDYIQFASTQTLEFQNMYKQKGVYSLSDRQVLNPGFVKRIRLENLPNQ